MVESTTISRYINVYTHIGGSNHEGDARLSSMVSLSGFSAPISASSQVLQLLLQPVNAAIHEVSLGKSHLISLDPFIPNDPKCMSHICRKCMSPLAASSHSKQKSSDS